MSANFELKDAMPVTLDAIIGHPNVYVISNLWFGDNKWISTKN